MLPRSTSQRPSIRIRAACALFSALNACALNTLASPIVDYRFNEIGNAAPSIGSDTAPVYFTNSSGESVDLHGAPGSGVTGGLGLAGSETDRAFDNTASTGMGNAGIGGMAAQAADDDAIDGLFSFTLSGWFKSQDDSLPGSARFFKNTFGPDTTAGYHFISGTDAGEVRLKVDSMEKSFITPFAPRVWVFLAATYDGKQTKNNFKIYEGFRTSVEAPAGDPKVVLVGSKTLNQGRVEQDTGVLQLGNENGVDYQYNRPYDGWLDNMRIDGSFTDSSGALTLQALETRRAADVSAPEPGSGMLLVVGSWVISFSRRRRWLVGQIRRGRPKRARIIRWVDIELPYVRNRAAHVA